MINLKLLSFCVLMSLLIQSKCSSSKSNIKKFVNDFSLNEGQAKKDLEKYTLNTHSFGSEYQFVLANYFKDRLSAVGVESWLQSFDAETPLPLDKISGPSKLSQQVRGHNVLAFIRSKKPTQCMIILGSHYDTKKMDDFDYFGANDGGSSSVLLLQVMEFLFNNIDKLDCSVLAIWFDGEESTLADWDMGEKNHPAKIIDNTYGSRYFASKLQNCSPLMCWSHGQEIFTIKAFILADMVGSKDLLISRDSNSDPILQAYLEKAANELDYKQYLSKEWISIQDDHIPFKKLGIPVLNIIDFNNLEFWHRRGDEVHNVSFSSLDKVGRMWLYVFALAQKK